MTDPRAILAARNNADWYSAVFSAHRLPHRLLPHAFVAEASPPPFYSDLTVLDPDSTEAVRAELSRLAGERGGPLGVKDSFCCLDLVAEGFRPLFDATWLWRAPCPDNPPGMWRTMTTPGDLARWEAAWKQNGSPADQRVFPDALLARTDVAFLAHMSDGSIAAGCIANLSETVVGLSNLFATDLTPRVYAEAAATVGAFGGHRPIVGYESGTPLSFATSTGFDPVGPLRVLVADAACFAPD